jgi:hypothetical protein
MELFFFVAMELFFFVAMDFFSLMKYFFCSFPTPREIEIAPSAAHGHSSTVGWDVGSK